MKKPRSFLSRGALVALAVLGPVLTLVTLPLEGIASPAHSIKCLVATWLTVSLTGALMHGFVNLALPRQSRLAVAAVIAVAQAMVVTSLLTVVPRLDAVGLRIPPHLAVFVVNGGVMLAALYLVAARAATVSADRARASQAEALHSRVLALQAQMNPHFLFNTLNAIAALIQLEPELAETMLERLAGVLQYAIAAGQKSHVRLKEELDVLGDYLSIEQARFGARLRTRIDVGPELYDFPLPPMLLQPLVENAVLHGIAAREEGGEVRISGRIDGDAVVLTVSDDGVGLGASKRQGTRVGLTSVRERMALAFGASGALDVRAREGGGCECELRMPRAKAA